MKFSADINGMRAVAVILVDQFTYYEVLYSEEK